MRVLFVCTDNFARSVIAEMCFNDYVRLNRIEGWKGLSAGLCANSDTSQFSTAHFDRLLHWNIDPSGHQRKQVDHELLNQVDLIVAMGKEHKVYLEKKFAVSVYLFNEVVIGEASSLAMDPSAEMEISEKMRKLTDEIYQAMPGFVQNVEHYCRS